MTRSWKIGALAREAGLSVRTLHHWDHLGLVQPSERTPSGHRLYAADDVDRLYEVAALRQLGLPLETIGAVLGDGPSLDDVLATHLDHLDRQLRALRALRARVAVVASSSAASPGGRDVTDVLQLIREVIDVDETTRKYFTPEQLTLLTERRAREGEQALAEIQAAWPELMGRVDDAVARGVDPASPEAQGLAREWADLLARFHGGDDGLRDALVAMQAENAERIEAEHGGPSPAQLDFIGRADAARPA